MAKSKFEYWPVFIVCFIGSFILLMIGLVIIAVNQPMNMVDKNYYEESLVYQSKKDALILAENLVEKPSISVDDRVVKLNFPQSILKENIDGKVTLYSPISSTEDFENDLVINENGQQIIDLSSKRQGKWVITLSWYKNDKHYLIQRNIVVGL